MTWARNLQEQIERRAADKAANLRGLATPSRALSRGTYSGGTSGAEPKTEPYRDPTLLEMAKDQPCLLIVPAVCNHRMDTTVAAHSNLSIHGKAGARKADDCYVVDACHACHYWLDFGKASAAQKAAMFQLGHSRQVLAWRLRAMDPKEPERFRKAARRALEQLNATPIGEEA